MTKNRRYAGGNLVDYSEKVQAFYDACTEMTKAKFILADAKISKILKTIVSCSDLVDIIADALNGFNFQNEFSKIQVKNDLKKICIHLPNDPKKLVAVVFSLLSEIDSHRIDLHTFIFDYFDGNGRTLLESYDKFVEDIILPFRDTMCELAGVEFEDEDSDEACESDENSLENADMETQRPTHDIEDEEDYNEELGNDNFNEVIDSFFNDIRVILNQIKDTVNLDNRVKNDRKDELNITIDALLIAIRYKNLKILNALMISLNYLLHPVRSVRFYNMELQNRLAKFYAEIY